MTEIAGVTKEDELTLKISFKLKPSKKSFSRITLQLHFDQNQMKPKTIRIPQGTIASNDSELNPVLDMKGISPGTHVIKAEMYESFASREKLTSTSKEINIEYAPSKRENQLVRSQSLKTSPALTCQSFQKLTRESTANSKKT